MKSRISISSLLIQPYCPSSAIATEFPGFDHFSTRTQFIPFERLSHVAVQIEAMNLAYKNTGRRKSRKSFFLNIRDMETRDIVASRTLCVVMDCDTFLTRERIDIPFRRSQMNPGHDYRVEVSHPGNDVALIHKDMVFQDLKRLPTRYYTPVAACIEKPMFDNSCEPMTIHLTTTSGITEGHTVSFSLVNNVPDARHRPELFMKFYGGDDSLKIQVCPCSLEGYEENGEPYVKVRCEVPRFLEAEGHLYVELLSMGYRFAGALFDISGDEDEEGEFSGKEVEYIPEYTHKKGGEILKKRKSGQELLPKIVEPEKPSLLDSLVGLDGVKSKLEGYRKLMGFYRLRRLKGLPVPATPLHCLFLGSPGTGKTTVAKELGRLLHECGALSSGHVVVRERATLIGQFYSSEAEKTLKALEEARGGILFIDEAYQLHQPDDPKDPGRFVLETLMTSLADTDDRDWMLILAGYTEPMLKMMTLNPGLTSRIPEVNYYRFADFSETQLMEIAVRYLEKSTFTLTPGALEALRQRVGKDYARRGEGFGNGRYVVNLIETEILPAMAARIAEISAPTRMELTTVLPQDIPAPRELPVAERRRIGFAS